MSSMIIGRLDLNEEKLRKDLERSCQISWCKIGSMGDRFYA